MPNVKRTEKVNVEYTGNKIIVKGKSFTVELKISKSELAQIYMSGRGNADSTITVDVPDATTTAETKKEETEIVSPSKHTVKTLDEIQSNQPPHRYEPYG